jgi:hypothetical protein
MKWPGFRNLFRFNLSTLLCMVLAINLVIYMNFLTKQPYFAYVYEGQSVRVRNGENYTRVTHYLVGWPVHFLSIEKQKVGMTPAQKPIFQRTYTLISWQSAASTAAASLALIAIYSWCLARLFRLVMPVARTKRPPKKLKAENPVAPELSKPG